MIVPNLNACLVSYEGLIQYLLLCLWLVIILKQLSCYAPILILPNLWKLFEVIINVSKYILGFILTQH